MLFDKNFDKSLWLLVAGNKKDSENVCKLISYIPEDICKNIQIAIRDYCNGGIKDSIIYKDTYNGVDGFDYYIVVKYEDDVINNIYNLCITLYRWKEKEIRIEEEYNLVLRYIHVSQLDNMLYFIKDTIGSYSSEINNIKFVGYLTDVDPISYERSFSLKKVPFRYIVSSYLGNRKKGIRYVNVSNDMPDEIYYEDFSSQEKINGLVKKRKRVNK